MVLTNESCAVTLIDRMRGGDANTAGDQTINNPSWQTVLIDFSEALATLDTQLPLSCLGFSLFFPPNGQWRFIVTIVPWLEWWLGLSLASVTIPNSHLCDMMLISIPKTYAARPVLAVFGATFLERWRWLRERSNTQHVSLLSHLVGCHVRSHDNPWQPERSTGLHIKHISSMKRHWSQQLKTWNFQHKCSFKSSSKASHIQCTPDSSQ